MQNVAQSWLVYRLTGSELLLGTTAFASTIPILLLGPIAGVVADRYSRRAIVVIAQSLFLLQAMVLAGLTLTGRVTVPMVIFLAAFLGVASAFEVPARQALIIHMTTREDLLGAISLNSAIFNSARVLGPSIGGFVVAAIGEGWCFFWNGVSFLAFIACFLFIRIPDLPRSEPGAPLRRLLEGIRYAHRTKVLRILLLNSGAVNLAVAPLLVLAPIFADALFQRGSRGLGVLMSALGAGAVIGTLTLARRSNTRGLAQVALHSCFLMSLSVIAYAAAPTFWASVAIMSLVGFSVFRQNASSNTLIQTLIDEQYRGRIMSLYSMMAIGMLPIGSIAGGYLAERVGARFTVCLSGLLCLAAAAVFWLNRRSLDALKETAE
jgi:MFS family permease